MPITAPHWLTSAAWISLLIAGLCCAVVVVDLLRRPQRMWIMNVVWPLTALYAGPLGFWAYWSIGRMASRDAGEPGSQGGHSSGSQERPFWKSVLVGATHCGSGCCLGDILGEAFLLAVPLSLFGHAIFAAWAIGYALAFLFGIAFQYFTIKPMRNLPPGKGLIAALKADSLSLSAWQVGMYGWMALVTFGIFGEVSKKSAVFWFMMQVAMLFGFATSFPVNWWLIRKGIKESM